MPIIKSAQKAHRASLKKYVFNKRRKDAMKENVKSVRKSISEKDKAGAEKKLPEAYKAIDKALKRGVIKENAAARKKSRLVAAIKKISA